MYRFKKKNDQTSNKISTRSLEKRKKIRSIELFVQHSVFYSNSTIKINRILSYFYRIFRIEKISISFHTLFCMNIFLRK